MRDEKIGSKVKNGQSFIQYTILIIIISAAVIGMTVYIMRSANARLSQSHQELDYYKSEGGRYE